MDDLLDIDDDAAVIVQTLADHFAYFGLSKAEARRYAPVCTSVFAVRSCDWSRALLAEAAAEERFFGSSPLWNGVGDQEAIIAVLKRRPLDLSRIRQIEGLHNHPRFCQSDTRFVHLLGDRAPRVLSEASKESAFADFEHVLKTGERPSNRWLAQLHMASVQCRPGREQAARGDLDVFLYSSGEEFCSQPRTPLS